MCLRREIAVGGSYLSAGFEGSLLGLFLKIAVENDGLSSRYRETALLDAKVPRNSEKRWYRDRFVLCIEKYKGLFEFIDFCEDEASIVKRKVRL